MGTLEFESVCGQKDMGSFKLFKGNITTKLARNSIFLERIKRKNNEKIKRFGDILRASLMHMAKVMPNLALYYLLCYIYFFLKGETNICIEYCKIYLYSISY